MELNFEEIFKVPLRAMKITRSHTDIPKNLSWFFQFLAVHSIHTAWFLIFSYNIIYYDLKAKDFAQTCRNGTISMVYLAGTFQYIVILWKHALFINLFNTVKTDYDNSKKLNTEDQQVIIKYAKDASWVGKLWCVMCLCGNFTFPIKNTVLHIYYYCQNDFRKIQLYDVVIPTVSEETANKMVPYILIYLLLMYNAVYSGVLFMSFAPLGPSFILHACGQMEILTKRVENLFSAHDVIAELKSIITELQKVYSFVEEIQNTFRVAYELIVKMTIIVLPITAFEIIEAFGHGDISVEFLVFICGALVHCTCPCYYSDLLKEKGETLRMAVYSCGWERTYDRRTRKMVALLLQRASRPVAIHTMFKILCLEMLTDVFHQSYAIFNLMNAVWK